MLNELSFDRQDYLLSGRSSKRIVRLWPIDELSARFGVPSLIAMDIEGAEVSSLRGAASTLSMGQTVWAISTYHRASDLVSIHQILSRFRDRYDFTFRLHDYGLMDQVEGPHYSVHAI